MTDEQQQADPLEAVRIAITDGAGDLANTLEAERDLLPPGAHPITSGVRLAYALGRLSDDQREALKLGFELSDQDRKLVAGLLRAQSADAPPDQ